MPLAFWIILILLLLLLSVAISLTLVTFFCIFYSSRKKQVAEEYPTPRGEVFDPYREEMRGWIKQCRELPHTAFSVVSEDGLRLVGTYYEYEKGAPIEILFHGYRGSSERDLSGGVLRCFALKRSALIVDHRGSGKSEGHVITFGAKESRDVHLWVDLVLKEIDPDARIILTGISMGAATVLTAAETEFPPNVVGILADCGYTSTRAIVSKVMHDLGLPSRLFYPFARLGARLLGGFDPDATSPIAAMEHSTLPILFFHGDADDFVPCTMSEENYAACRSKDKRLVITKGAGHALCYPTDRETYLAELDGFFRPYLSTDPHTKTNKA